MPRASIPGRRLFCALLVALSLPLLAQSAGEPAKDDPSVSNAEAKPRASSSLLLDMVRSNAGYFAVGERGHVLTSTDGRTWTQANVPTRSALTSIATADGQLWAAGHDGVILHSADNGQAWSRRRVSVWQPGAEDITQGVPVLDLLFTDASNGIAVGAYSLMLVTGDGGATWTAKRIGAASPAPAAAAPSEASGDEWTFSSDELQLQEESDPHFNAIARTGSGAMVIVGERGTVYRSRDNGATWQKARFPYQGSMFGVLAWEGEHILAFGLRGNAYESRDLGDTWTKVDTGSANSLQGGYALPNGGAVLVGANGKFLVRGGSNDGFVASTFQTAAGEAPVLSGVLPDGNGGYVVIGDKGVGQYSPK